MARISGVDLPREKRVEIGLTYIFGIGLKTYQAVEQGARGATIDMLCVLRSFYGVSLDYLVYGEAYDNDLSFALQGLSAEEMKQILDVVNGIIRFGEMKNSHKNGE